MNFSSTRILRQILISSLRGEVYNKEFWISQTRHGNTISTMFVSGCIVLHRDSLHYQTLPSILFPLWTLSSLLFMVDLVKMVAFRSFIFRGISSFFSVESTYVTMQELLESHNIPFVGTGSSECSRAFDKVVNKIWIIWLILIYSWVV